MVTYTEPYHYPNNNRCKKHPTYKVMRQPTADCEQCRVLWQERFAQKISAK